MRKELVTLALVVATCGCTSSGVVHPRFVRLPSNAVATSAPWEPVEGTALHWPDGRTAQLVIERSDLQDSPRLRISQSATPDYVVTPPGGIDKLPESLAPKLLKRNSVESAFVFVPRAFHASAAGIVVMVTGRSSASDPGSFYALSLAPGAEPRELLASEAFTLTDLADLDHDGITELIGKHSLSQKWGRCFLTYDPFSVYRLPSRPDVRAERSLALSEHYNRAHYYGWAGPDTSEAWAVVLCAAGGPEIMTAADAERLFGK